jgi:hypothetical protein
VLYQTVARAWPKIEIEYAVNEQAIAPRVTAKFVRYTRCEILEDGFVRLYCRGPRPNTPSMLILLRNLIVRCKL